MKKLIALLLALSVLFCLCACANGGQKISGEAGKPGSDPSATQPEAGKPGSDPSATQPEAKPAVIYGTWKTDVDCTNIMAETLLGSGLDISTSEKIIFTFTLVLNEDGSFVYSLEKDSAANSVNAYIDAILPQIADMVCEEAGMSRAELEAQLGGMTIEDLMRTQIPDVSQFFANEKELTGKYELDGDKIFFFEDGGSRNEEDYAVYTLAGDTLSCNEASGKVEEGLLGDGSPITLPLVFTR